MDGQIQSRYEIDLDPKPNLVSLPTVRRQTLRRQSIDESLKRAIDVIGALAVLILLLPIFVLLALLIAQDGGPVLYRHERVGKNGRPFGCLKFRTMAADAQARLEQYLSSDPEAMDEWKRDHKLRFDPRVTYLGAYFRKTSLDELPQFWNVLLGDMSLVGPRPVTRIEMRDRYGPHADVVTSVRPGVTGVWQISGRNDISYEERVAMDVHYVHSRSLLIDLGILFQTIPCLLSRNGR